jgi:hypothetical protein
MRVTHRFTQRKNAFPKFVQNLRALPHNISIRTNDYRNARSGIMALPNSTEINHMVKKIAERITQERMNTRT